MYLFFHRNQSSHNSHDLHDLPNVPLPQPIHLHPVDLGRTDISETDQDDGKTIRKCVKAQKKKSTAAMGVFDT